MKLIVHQEPDKYILQITDWNGLFSLFSFEDIKQYITFKAAEYWKTHYPEDDSFDASFFVYDTKEDFIYKVYELLLPAEFKASDIKEDEWELLRGVYQKYLKRSGLYEDALVIEMYAWNKEFVDFLKDFLSTAISERQKFLDHAIRNK